MVTQLRIDQLEIAPGQRVVLRNVDWPQFEAILTDLGEARRSRVAYYARTLELRMPLPEHERAIVIISDLLKILLDVLVGEWESLRSSTFRNVKMQAGVEPDDCFYIHNYAAIVGKKRLDLAVDPPPDLVLEVNMTSMTQVSAYEALGVPEIWRYQNQQLKVFVLRSQGYVESANSPALGGFADIDQISNYVNMGNTIPISQIRRDFRQWLAQPDR
ncbi:MAG: Uma2 family endonuclease [Cyanobacteria bacterium J06626_23]